MAQIFNGTLTDDDNKRHIDHYFQMPADATKLTISFECSPQQAMGAQYPNQMSLSLFAPDGCRGARHNNADQTIRLSNQTASTGYVPGRLIAGQWNVVLDTHRILPPDTVRYTITVDISSEPIEDQPYTFPVGSTASRGKGWYRGDLHGHTFHSDGSWNVPDFVNYAREIGLDFVTLTDHNTVSALAEIDSLSCDDILTMGGMELTTYYGHALALDTRQWHEWRKVNGLTMHDIAQSVLDSGAFYVIAHPRSDGDPSCTGCRWEHDEMMPGIAPAVEIWNEHWSHQNEEGLQLYYQWLNEGHKLVATAGTDIHGKPSRPHKNMGYNVVYADNLSEKAIIEAIRKGHLYLSAKPTMTFTAESFEKTVMMGDTLNLNQAVELTATWDDVSEGEFVYLIKDGKSLDYYSALESDSVSILINETGWYLFEIRDAEGDLRAITNPIWVE